MSSVSMRDLLEAGAHFGHQTRRWNPKMKPYIFGARNGIYIIDLQKTLRLFREAAAFVVARQQLRSEVDDSLIERAVAIQGLGDDPRGIMGSEGPIRRGFGLFGFGGQGSAFDAVYYLAFLLMCIVAFAVFEMRTAIRISIVIVVASSAAVGVWAVTSTATWVPPGATPTTVR